MRSTEWRVALYYGEKGCSSKMMCEKGEMIQREIVLRESEEVPLRGSSH